MTNDKDPKKKPTDAASKGTTEDAPPRAPEERTPKEADPPAPTKASEAGSVASSPPLHARASVFANFLKNDKSKSKEKETKGLPITGTHAPGPRTPTKPRHVPVQDVSKEKSQEKATMSPTVAVERSNSDARATRRQDDAYREEDIAPHPAVDTDETIVDVSPLRPPFAFARIVYREESHTHRYEVIEPPLEPEERAAFLFLKDAFVRTLDVDMAALDQKGATKYLAEQYEVLARRHHLKLSPLSRARIGYYLERDFIGYGAIDVLMQDGAIEDISCDGPGLPIFIYHRKYSSVRTNLGFPSEEALDGFVMHLVQRSGKHISVAEPLVDATLPEGSRLQASLSREVTTRGSTFTIRKFRADPLTPTDLLLSETMSPHMMGYLWLAVEHGASGIICGGTASGKTTTLNAMSVFIPPQKKIVSIEDTREINLTHENWIPGVTRAGAAAHGGGKRVGEVDMFDLLRAALRQRPEYLLLGEVRGPEAYVLFQAMATGHTVYSTMHADGVASAVHRLESKPIEVPRTMLSALDFVTIQAEAKVGAKRMRKMRELVEITGVDPRTGELLTNRVFHWDPSDSKFRFLGASFVLRRIAEELNVTEAEVREELDRRVRFLDVLVRRHIRDIGTVSHLIARYLLDPKRALAELERG